MNRFVSCCAGVAVAGLLAGSASAALYDDFESGYVAGPIAGQTGGTGWVAASAWTTSPATPNSDFAADVASGAAAIDGSSLIVTGQDLRGVAYREYDTTVVTAPYTLSFTVKINNLDSLLAGGGSGGNSPNDNAADYLNLFERPGTSNDFGGNGSWLVRGGQLKGGGNGEGQFYDASAPFNWYAFDYDALVSNGFTDATVVNTGIAIAEGRIYQFDIGILGGGLWSLAIEDDLGNTFTSASSYGFRSDSALPSGNVKFGFSDAGTSDDLAEGVSFAVDNIVIPEPGTALLAAAGIGCLLLRRRA